MCSRTLDDRTVAFGTTGYTLDDVFVLYDRDTDSIWYPLGDQTLDAVAGSRKGTAIDLLAEPSPVRLGDWLDEHPTSLVLLPPKEDLEARNRGYLGVRLDGVTVTEVMSETAAEAAGIEAGDVITRIGDATIGTRRELSEALAGTRAGDEVVIVVEREGEVKTLRATLGRRPEM